MTYFVSPTWFIDFSYTYALTNSRTVNQQAFANSGTTGSTNYTTSGTLFTQNTLQVINQSATITINKVFDI